MAPKYAKQPKEIRRGAWVRLGARLSDLAGVVGQVVEHHYDSLTIDTQDDRASRLPRGSVLGSVQPSSVTLLTPEEAAPFIAARAARLEREDTIKASRAPDVSGRSHFARTRR